jgi:glutamate-1-semialdehyde 2,1-aminomutase
MTNVSRELFLRARDVMPGGVSSPVRAFRAVGRHPIFIQSGTGPFLIDADGREYVDYVMSWGPLILGHAHPEVLGRVQETVRRGLSYGAPCESELELARRIVDAVPGVDKVRLVNSGTEAVMSAVRLARAVTGRDAVVKFEGGYHGHADGLLVRAGSGALTFGTPSSPGVPDDYARHTVVCRYNDPDSVREALAACPVAAVLVEPVAGNMGVVPPAPGFLEALREMTTEAGALLLFDEVITGFRVSFEGAQGAFGVMPDITTLGKIIGGGMPVGAYGARAEVMDRLAPEGDVYQAGTLSGNPVTCAAGAATLKILEKSLPYGRLEELGARLEEGLRAAAEKSGVRVVLNRVGSALTLFFTGEAVSNFADVQRTDTEKYARFFHAMLDRGVYLPPSAFEGWFLSAAHAEKEVDRTVAAAEEVLALGGF